MSRWPPTVLFRKSIKLGSGARLDAADKVIHRDIGALFDSYLQAKDDAYNDFMYRDGAWPPIHVTRSVSDSGGFVAPIANKRKRKAMPTKKLRKEMGEFISYAGERFRHDPKKMTIIDPFNAFGFVPIAKKAKRRVKSKHAKKKTTRRSPRAKKNRKAAKGLGR